jgi:hypothetical protein
MNCGEVREHLSEYMDEGLEATTKASVEEHLSACKDCQKEAASLRMLINDLGSMETVAPPKDFLEQLHKRMERRSRFSRILDTLSVPMRAKLPVKFAGAVVVVILAFTIFQIQKDQYGTKWVPSKQETTQSEPSPLRMAKTPLVNGTQEEVLDTEIVREKAKQQPQAMRAAAERDEAKRLPDNGAKEVASGGTMSGPPPQEGDPIERSQKRTAASMQEPIRSEISPPKMAQAPLETDVQGEADNAGVVKEWVKPNPQAVQQVAQKDEITSLPNNVMKKIAHVGTKADQPLRKGAPIELSLVIERGRSTQAFEVSSAMEAPHRAQDSKMGRTLTVREVAPTTQPEREKSIEQILPRLREVIERTGGELVSLEYEEGTRILQSVHVEIPAEEIGKFQSDLQALGELHGVLMDPMGEDERIVAIRIDLLTP